MTVADLLNNVDYSPLQNLGLDKEDSLKFLAALSPLIDVEFQQKITSSFTDEEMDQIGTEAEFKGIKPEDGMFLLEEKYYEKTGKKFTDEFLAIFNNYVNQAALLIEQAKRNADIINDSGEENIKKFEEHFVNKNWEEAAKLFDETLKNNPPSEKSSS